MKLFSHSLVVFYLFALLNIPKTTTGQTQTYIYPAENGQAMESEYYKVFLKIGNGEEKEIQVLQSNAIYSGDYREDYLRGRTFSFAQVVYDTSRNEELTFRVVKTFGQAANTILLAPSSYGLTMEKSPEGKEVSFNINDANRYISVNFRTSDNTVSVTQQQSWIKHMLCIFVDPTEKSIPDPEDDGVIIYSPNVQESSLKSAKTIFFLPGYYNLENYQYPGSFISKRGKITLKESQKIYIAGGAFVEGNIETEGNNNRIYGRGILSLRQYDWKNSAHFDGYDAGYVIHLGNSSVVEGIMCMEPPWHGIVGKDNNLIENIKFLGWHCNNDGIRVGSGSEIRNSFIRAVDDDFYNFNIHAHDLVLWKGHNGAVMTFGWGGNNTYFSGASLMENIDIINPEWTGLGNNNGLIMSQTAYDYIPWDYETGSSTTVIRNIRIEGKIPGLTNLKTKQGSEMLPMVEKSRVGYLGDLILENISVNAQFEKGILKGKQDVASNAEMDYFLQNVTLEEIKIGGICVTEENKDLFFNIDENTTRDLTFRGCNETGIQIRFIHPKNESKLIIGDSLVVEAEITDNDSIENATLFVDNQQVSTKTEPPFIWENESILNELGVGRHTICIQAIDNEEGQWEEEVVIEVVSLPNAEGLTLRVHSDSALALNWLPRTMWTGSPERVGGFIIERATGEEGIFEAIDTLGAADTSYLDYPLQEFTLYKYRMRTLYGAAGTDPGTEVPGRTKISNHAPLPNPWKNHSFGDTLVAMAATSWFKNDSFTIDAGDGDFWTETCRGHMIYQSMEGDCEIRALMTDYTGLQSFTMAGLMIRDSLDNGSPFAAQFLIMNPGAIVRFRIAQDGPVNQEISNTGETAPYWLRLKRLGNSFSGYVSPDGISWKLVRTGNIEMDEQVFAGMAATTHTTDGPGIYSFTHVETGSPLKEYNLIVSADPGGSITPGGNHLVLESSSISFLIEPREGYKFTNILLDGNPMGNENPFLLENISGDHEIKAEFSRITGTVQMPAQANINIYPIPCNQLLYIDNESNEEKVEIEILDLSGRILIKRCYQPGKIEISTGDLRNGVYILRIVSRSVKTQQKLIIHH